MSHRHTLRREKKHINNKTEGTRKEIKEEEERGGKVCVAKYDNRSPHGQTL